MTLDTKFRYVPDTRPVLLYAADTWTLLAVSV